MVLGRLAVVPWLLLPALVACGAEADAPGADEDSEAIVGTTTADAERPEVVRLTLRSGALESTCTGTLIGARTVLTARHCLESRTDRATGACTVEVLLDRAGRGTADGSAETYPAARCDLLEPTARLSTGIDLGTIRLARDVVGVAPAVLADEATPGGSYTAYGYGSFGAAPTFGVTCEHHSDGHKRKASYRGPFGFSFGQLTCPGDSGGPHFVARSNVVAAVTSGGYAVVAAYETNAGVARHRDWILGMLRTYGDRPAR
jgi:secreted trypsin-like serine protease